MSSSGTVYLMYHELELPGRPLCREGEGYWRYVVSIEDFRQQIAQLQAQGFRGTSVGEALAGNGSGKPAVAITFDDGCETDLITAAPLLREANFSATFYVVAGFVGQRGYMSQRQVRELADAGFEVGCHSMTHAYLPDVGREELRAEVAEAKNRLEQFVGRPVEHFSCPGGRWSPQVAAQAREAGYRSVTTSRIGINTPGADPFRLARVVVLRGTSLAAFRGLCRGEGFLFMQAREAALGAAKTLLGNSLYEKVRAAILDRG